MSAVRFGREVGAEWIKLRTVHSTFYLVFMVALFIPMSALIAWQSATGWDAATAAERAAHQPTTPENGLLMMVQLCVAALGVLAITSEYASGMIRTTFVTMPRRGAVLLAKAVVVGAVSLVVGQVTVFAMYLLARLVIGDRPIPAYRTALAEEIPRLSSLGVSALVVGLIGLGLGALTRSTAGGLTIAAALLFVFPTFGRLLPEPWDERFTSVTLPRLPLGLAGAPDALLSPPWAALAMAGYVVAVLGLAVVVVQNRDA